MIQSFLENRSKMSMHLKAYDDTYDETQGDCDDQTCDE